MAIKFIANYSKRLGLPGYSSHQYSISVEVELTDLERAPGEAARLYHQLQQSVDREIQQTGFVPGDSYGMPDQTRSPNGADHQQVHHQLPGAVPPENTGPAHSPTWQCSTKQHQLIDDLVRRIGLGEPQLDERALRLFGKPAHQLNKLSASGLISDLLAEAGPRRSQNGTSNTAAANRNGGGA